MATATGSISGVAPLAKAVRELLDGSGLGRLQVAQGGVPLARAQRTRFPRLLLVLQGCLRVDTGGATGAEALVLERGDTLFSPEFTWDRPDWEGSSCTALSVLFGVRHIGLSLVTLEPQGPSVHKAGSEWPPDGVLQSLLGCLRSCTARPERVPYEGRLLEAALEECLVSLQRGASGPEGKALRTFESLCLYIQAHLALPLTREGIAAHFGLSPNHVSRLFRQQGHRRFVDYLNQVRVDRARQLLREADLSIKEVASRAGFRDHAYFHRVFRKMAKVTPLAYRFEQAEE